MVEKTIDLVTSDCRSGGGSGPPASTGRIGNEPAVSERLGSAPKRFAPSNTQSGRTRQPHLRMAAFSSRRGRRALLRGTAAITVAPWLLGAARTADVQRFGLGIASGQPEPDRVVLWTRITGPDLPERVPVRWEIARDEAFTDIAARGEEIAERDWAHSVHAELGGLDPARWYWYRFHALGDRSGGGRTRTAPAPDAAVASLDFAIAGCQRCDAGHDAAWRHAAAEHLDLVMFLGDYIYEYGSPPNALRSVEGGRLHTLAQYRARYATHKSDPDLQAAHAAAPWLLVWDDHEVGNDYANLRGERLEPDFAAIRAAAYRAYWEHMPFPESARPSMPTCASIAVSTGDASHASTSSTTGSTAMYRSALARIAATRTPRR